MNVLLRIGLCTLLAVGGASANAQTWPDKPVKFIIPTPAGTTPDIVARILGEKLGARWGQQVIVDNRPGAGGITAMSAFTRSPPDGYTFGLIHTGVIALTPHLFKDAKFNVDTDVQTISIVVSSPLVIAVNPKLGVSTLADLVKLAKAKPEHLTFAAPLINSVPHLAAEMLSRQLGIELHVVPYNGSTASVTATIAGDGVDLTMDAPAPLVPHFKSGRLKPIAVTASTRLPELADVPTVAETLPNFRVTGWFGLFAPAKTSTEILERVNRDVNAVIQMPDVVARFSELGLYPTPGTMAEAADFVKADRARWESAIRKAGIKPE